jgi:multicomponent Na+:H+ antiporter subunit E
MKILTRIGNIIVFFTIYFYRLILSNFRVAYDVLTPTLYMNPAIYEVPVSLKKDHEILALVNLVTMTPGTLSLDLSKDKSRIYIHSMYTGEKEEFVREIEWLEKRIHRSFG